MKKRKNWMERCVGLLLSLRSLPLASARTFIQPIIFSTHTGCGEGKYSGRLVVYSNCFQILTLSPEKRLKWALNMNLSRKKGRSEWTDY